VRLTVTNDALVKTDETRKNEAKYVILLRNTDGYKNLIKIWSFAAKDGFYYEPRIDFKTLKLLWDDKNLLLAIPFYDSFLFMNALEGHSNIPDIHFTKPVFFLENHDLPFDDAITARVRKYCCECRCDAVAASSIFYHKKEDFLAYLSFRCVHSRTTTEKPELNHFSSDAFSFEYWKKINEKNILF
jgi:DNA polymerase-3 subunit alpha